MKKYLLLLAALLFLTNTYAYDRVSFSISKPLCLLTFMQAASGTGSVSPSLGTYIKKNLPDKDTTVFHQLLREFAQLEVNYSYVFPAYPLQRQHPKTIINLINIAAVQSANITEFMSRIIGVLPNEQWLQLKKIMIAAEPIYDQLIFAPYAEEIQQQLAALRALNSSTDSIFTKLKHFYGSTWSDDMPFTISIYPVPAKRGATSATPHSNSLVLGVRTGEKDHIMSLGIAIHEICHVLYEEQPLALQQRTDSFFTLSNSAYNQYAYSYVDEALATACGNGWAYKALSGHEDKTGWYNDPYINGYAHALYPQVTEYIEHGKAMDVSFVQNAIALFEQTFPDAIYDRQIQLNSVNLYTDAVDNGQYNQVNNVIRRYFNIRSCSGSYPIADPESLAIIDRTTGTQFFIVHTNHEKNYEALKSKFPQMKEMDANKEGIISFFDDKKRPVIIVNVSNISRLDKGIEKLAGSKMKTTEVFSALN